LATVRDKLIAQAEWGIAHTGEIHYAEVRPIPLAKYKAHTLPLTTDCSGYATCCAYAAGAADPNGQGYNGQGYTGTLLQHLPHITKEEAVAGDFVVFGPYPGEHVVVLLQDGKVANPAVASHGMEAGPLKTTLSVEVAGHNKPTTFLRSVPIVSKTNVWDIRDGRNELLAKGVKHPAIWAMRHPKSFRRHSLLSFHRRSV